MSRCFSALLAVLLLAIPALALTAEPERIGVTVTDLGNPFFVRIARGVENAARRIIGPDVRVHVASSAYDVNRQSEQMDDFVRRKVDLIVLIAADPQALEPAVRRAQAQGVRVVAVDVRAAGADATFTTDNVQAGMLACQHIVRKLNGKGKVVIVSGPPVSAITDRVTGCLPQLEAAPGILVLSANRNGGGTSEGAFARMTDLLTIYPQIDAVFAINDPTALGVEEAARQAGRREFFIVGIDGSPKVRQRLREADSLIAASVTQSPDTLAQKAVETGYALLRNETPTHREELITPLLITRENPPESTDWAR